MLNKQKGRPDYHDPAIVSFVQSISAGFVAFPTGILKQFFPILATPDGPTYKPRRKGMKYLSWFTILCTAFFCCLVPISASASG